MDLVDLADHRFLAGLMTLDQEEDKPEEEVEDDLEAEEESEAVVVTWKKWPSVSSEAYVESSLSEIVPSEKMLNRTCDQRKPQCYEGENQNPWSSPR